MLLTARDHLLCVSADSLCHQAVPPSAAPQTRLTVVEGADGQPGGDSRLTCRSLSAACRQHLPKNQFVCVTCRKRLSSSERLRRNAFNSGRREQRHGENCQSRFALPRYRGVFMLESG